jgi:2-oxoglutarate dehydrogenase E2 component (dihydrolipoamide succinyltransferase)
MTLEVRVPQLPESVADATLVAWHKKVGELVSRDENLADLETDKVVLEVPAPASGVIKSLDKTAGTTVTSGELLAVIEEQATGAAPKSPAKAEASKPAETKKTTQAPAPTQLAPKKEEPAGKLSPAARRMVEENKLSAGEIAGSGRDGRISKSDVTHHLEAAPAPSSTQTASAGRVDQRVPMSRLRARIAQRLVEAQTTQALLTTFNEIDMQALMALRARYKEPFEKRHGVRLGFMSFFAKACVEALRRFPVVNASVEGSDIDRKSVV